MIWPVPDNRISPRFDAECPYCGYQFEANGREECPDPECSFDRAAAQRWMRARAQEGPSSASGGEDVSEGGDALNVGAAPAGDVARSAHAFPWRPGMKFADYIKDEGYLSCLRYCEGQQSENGWPILEDALAQARPDPNDGPTRGGFLEAIRERYADPHIGISFESGIDGQSYWRVGLDYEHPCGRAELGTHPTSEMAALQAAWDTAP
jgi:hypothetical protein